MGEAAEAAGDGGSSAGDGGAGDARAVRCRCGAPRPAAEHTAARRRVRTGRPFTITSSLSASRADEKHLPATAEQVRERRARVGGRGGRGAAARGRRGQRGRQEGRAAAEGHALVGAHGRAAAAALPANQRAAALRHGAAPRRALAAARCVTSPRLRTSLSYHAYIPLSGRSDSPKCTRVPKYYRLGNLFIWDSRPRRAAERERLLCDMCDRVVL